MHSQVLVRVNAYCDAGIAQLVVALSELPGVVTLDSCECFGATGEALVSFTYGETWQELASMLQRISSGLAAPGLPCGYRLRMEWVGSNDRPRAEIVCRPEHVADVAGGIRALALT